jgi:hypothetical protein
MKGLVQQKPKADDSRYMLRTGNLGYLRLKNDNQKPSFDNFAYDGDCYNAVMLDNKESAFRYIDGFMIKRPKLLKKLGGLTVVSVDFAFD